MPADMSRYCIRYSDAAGDNCGGKWLDTAQWLSLIGRLLSSAAVPSTTLGRTVSPVGPAFG